MNLIFFNTVALGDYLVHSKLIKDFKSRYNCHITAVCSPYNARLIKYHKHIDKIILYDSKYSFKEKILIIKKILQKNYFLSVVFDCKKFSMLCNFLIKSKYKRGILMQKYKKLFSFKFFIYYPSKFIGSFLYDKYIVHKRINYIDRIYYLPSTWINLLSDFKIKTHINNIYVFNPNMICDSKKKLLLKKLKIKKYILFHLDHKWNDIIDIKDNFYLNLLNLNSLTNKNILLTSFNNKSDYFKILEKKVNIFNSKNFKLFKRNNNNIYLIKNPNIFLQERLISSSDLNISCHSGILVHGSGANKKKIIDILNWNEVRIQKCWAPLKNYKVIKKSTNRFKIELKFIFNQILKKIIKT